MLGRAFVRAPPTGWQLHPMRRADLDITDEAAVKRMLRASPWDIVLNCAAFTDVDGAEAQPQVVERANTTGPDILSKHCANLGIILAHISTDFVFDGRATEPYRETAPTRALSVYGDTKLQGERAIARHSGQHLIVRTAWLYDHDARCFPNTIIELAKHRDQLSVVDDQTGSPTYAPHLVTGIARALHAQARGVLHLAGSGAVTRYNFTKALLSASEIDIEMGTAKSADFPSPATRPAYSALASNHPCGIQLPPWQDGVTAFVKRRTDR